MTIWGIDIHIYDIPEKTRDLLFIHEFQPFEDYENYRRFSGMFFDDLKKLCKSVGLQCYIEFGDLVYIGDYPNKMSDDQTLGEFKEEIKNKLKEIGIENTNIEYYVGLEEEY